MSTTANDTLKRIIIAQFTEAYEGPHGPDMWTWFVNNEPDAGVFGTIAGLTADQASQPVIEGGRSIAAHVEHLRWSLANVNATARGKPWNPDWSASWSVQQVDAQQWNELRDAIRREFDLVIEAINGQQDFSDETMLTGMFALAPHAAHHLGAIRLMAKLVMSGHDARAD